MGSVENTVKILRYLHSSGASVYTVKEIRDGSGVLLASCYRTVKELCKFGVLRKTSDKEGKGGNATFVYLFDTEWYVEVD